MVKIYFNDGTRKKVSVRLFIYWLIKRNLEIDESNIYFNNVYIAKYVYLPKRDSGVLVCILLLILLVIIILALMKGGVILWQLEILKLAQ